MKLLPMPSHRRSFYMPDHRSSCCNGETKLERRGEFSCVVCGKELHPIGNHPRNAISFTDLDGIFVNDNEYGKRVRQVKYTSKYFISNQHGKIVRINNMNSFTYNWATGRLYGVTINRQVKKMVRDITYTAPVYMLKKEFIIKVIQMRAFYLLPEVDIIRDIEQSMGVNDLFAHLDKIANDGVKQERVVRHVLYCLAYPKFAWMSCPLHIAPTPQFRKALKDAHKSKDLYGAFFNGNVGKSTIAFLNDPLLGRSETGWAAVRFLSMFLNKDKVWGIINSGAIINLMEGGNQFFEPNLEKEITKKSIIEFTSEYGIQRFLNHILNGEMTASGIRMLIKDSIVMWEKIKEQLPEYVVPEANSIRGTHDSLSRDTRKLSIDNEDIQYTNRERDYESTFGKLDMVLPPDVHSIIDNGDKMSICVGGAGYTKRAVDKDITIMFGIMDNAPVLCMEIRKRQLVQAKLVNNDQAKTNDYICEAIKKLCEDNNINYSNCYDVQSTRDVRFIQPQAAAAGDIFPEAEPEWPLDELNF